MIRTILFYAARAAFVKFVTPAVAEKLVAAVLAGVDRFVANDLPAAQPAWAALMAKVDARKLADEGLAEFEAIIGGTSP